MNPKVVFMAVIVACSVFLIGCKKEVVDDPVTAANGGVKYDANGGKEVGDPKAFSGGEDKIVIVPPKNDPRFKPDPNLATGGGG